MLSGTLHIWGAVCVLGTWLAEYGSLRQKQRQTNLQPLVMVDWKELTVLSPLRHPLNSLPNRTQCVNYQYNGTTEQFKIFHRVKGTALVLILLEAQEK